MTTLFDGADPKGLQRPVRIDLLTVRPGDRHQVYLGEQQASRFLCATHFEGDSRGSFECTGPGCDRCKAGWVPRTYLYVAAKLAYSFRELLICLSADVASDWLQKTPDFRHLFDISRGPHKHSPVKAIEITTHGKLDKCWPGFSAGIAVKTIFERKAAKLKVQGF